MQFAELEKATNDFNEANRIGKQGTVYKASLPNGWILAVKRFNESIRSEKKFFSEATIMSSNSTVSTLGSGETWVLGCDRKDVYGFGIVLLELVTREDPIKLILLCNNSGGTSSNFMSLYDAIDESLLGQGFEDEINQFLVIACKCVQSSLDQRPSMFDV
ncbi:hypothetical protein RJ639_015032 [Escallonia herrerae]|uniref:Uncharacterized protein n=1 Tax=Escallonia herrerae TaxID=1293975 RepID=A0AA88VIZ7_9ASTE|nr:hypothetical protein RJ639_015032 [Escallonia herrerae]